LGNLSIPLSVQKLQTALQAKAKENPAYRFYALYDKVYRDDILQFAYLCCKSNGGAAGVDGQEFEDIESYGRERWLGELTQELREKKYQPQAVRRVFIPKRGGTGLRPLGIPSIRDRTVKMATVLVLGPIIEADLPPEQHAYRPERNALSAVRQVYKLLNTGHTKVIDADLAAYFDSIPHLELLRSVARRVVDRHVLHLIRMWLTAPVEETDKRGNKKQTTRNRDEKRGIPQGSPLSPLLSNIYMRRFVLGWQKLGYAERYKARIEEKTHYCRVPRQHFDFLGYTFGRYYPPYSGRAYLSARPSKRSVRRQIESIREKTAKRRTLLPAEQIVTELNDGLRGWANYFALGPVEDAYRAIESYVTRRLRRWLCIKHEVRGSGCYRFTDQYLHDTLGLVRI
jgi:RNA-directed DNA polymerase